MLGGVSSVNSQNRYAYAEADPVNNADPSGHAITANAYERQMEGAGGINEIYNLYVGRTLQNSYGQASGAFYSRLSYAYGVDYTDLAAINSISQVSQATADYYISQGAAMARAAGRTWGCAPGSLANMAIGSFAANVNAAKDSVNSQIASVKNNKYYQYEQYQAYLAYLAWVAEVEAAEAAAAEAAALSKQVADLVGNILNGLWQGLASALSRPMAAPPPAFTLSDVGHTALDLLGFIPGVGIVADGVNALWYLAEGDYVNAAFSAASMVPGLGDAAAAAKLTVKAGTAIIGAGTTAIMATTKTGRVLDAASSTSNALRHTPDQQALVALAKDAKRVGGVSEADAKTLVGWADEYNLPARGPEVHPNRTEPTSNAPHIHVGPVGHIPIQ